jgi:FkbM family methyltransferase
MNKYFFNIYITLVFLLLFLIFKNFILTLYFIYKNNIKVGDNIINFVYIYNEIFYDNDYNLNIKLDNCVIFDIGANMGIFSLWINEKFKNTKIYLFEPIHYLLDIAKYNLTVMKKNNNKFFYNCYGLSNTNKNEIINYYPYANGLCTIKNFDEKLQYHTNYEQFLLKIAMSKKEKYKIKLLTLKYYIEKYNIQNIDICKIDVEGLEKEVIEGFFDKINIVKIFIIEIENFRLDNFNNIKDCLHNYKIIPKTPLHNNFIMIHAIRKDLTL